MTYSYSEQDLIKLIRRLRGLEGKGNKPEVRRELRDVMLTMDDVLREADELKEGEH